MKKVSILSLIAFIAIVISSCGSSNNVVSNHGISKRKYTKGLFFQRKSNLKTANTKVKEAELRNDKSLAKIEKAEKKKAKLANRKKSTENSDLSNIEPTRVSENQIVNEEVPETGQFLTDSDNNEDEINSSVIENQGPAKGESIEEMPFENRDQFEKKNNSTSSSDSGLMFILAVVFAILIPPLGVAIYTNIDWMKVLIALLLTFLFFLPGMIYALLVVFDIV